MQENQNIEWKEIWKDEYLKWICGFANANGGKIFIGKNDKGEIVGLKNYKKLLEDIPNKIKNILGILVDVNLHKTKSGNYIEIIVEKQPFPVNYKGQYFYRSGSTNQELKGLALDKFMLQKKGKTWDSIVMPNVKITDLDNKTFEFFKNKANNSKRIDDSVLTDNIPNLLENLKLLENKQLKRAAILLFHPDPEKFITGAFIKIGYFQTDTELIYQDEIHGNLFEQIEKTIELLFTKYIKAIISYEGIHRVETYEYPKEAVREAVLNALTHKDYSASPPIQISVYDDKIMIWNYGKLPENWTIENLTIKHSSIPFNPDIANTFFRAGYVESWGRGTIKIIEKCNEQGLPNPEFSNTGNDFWLIFRKDIYNEEFLKSIKLNHRQLSALLFWKKEKEITNSMYSKKYNITDRTALRDLNDLVKKGLLKKIGKKKKTKYVYKL